MLNFESCNISLKKMKEKVKISIADATFTLLMARKEYGCGRF